MTASIISGVNLLVLNVPPPLEEDGVTLRDDLLGLKVWYSLTPNFDELTEGTLAYDGAGLSATIAGLASGVNYYVKYALISDIDPSVYDVSEELTAQAVGVDEVVDPTPPPTPTGVSVSAGITSVIISHDTPTYAVGNGHRRTLVYGKIRAIGAPLPTYNDNDISVIVEFTGSTTSFATEPGTTWHLWLKWLSNDGVLSEIPSGGTNGHVATTGQDVTKLLDVLAGEISESQLADTLKTRIDLVDDPETGLVKKTDDLVITYGNTASAAASAVLAESASAEAIQAKADAITAQEVAESASAEAIQAKADAIIAQVASAGSANTAATQAGLATTAKNEATTSATNAATSASSAATSATNAAGSASTASTQAGLATTAKDAAATSETNASQSASAAATSATNAAGSASTATTQAGLATSAKDDAEDSATDAAVSASSAATSATNAAGSASTATTQAGLATSAKDAAATSETNAATSASSAATSATNAAGSASTATTQAGLATTAKNAAATSATNASQSASAAATSATNAAGSASTASTQAGLATTAKNAATTSATNAATSATSAATSASNAAGSASTASTQAGLATSAKDDAEDSATDAAVSASSAATSATNAAGSASTATTQAGLATSAKEAAATSETNASQSASAAATSASNAAGSASTATTQAGLATSAKDAAATSETNASQSASAAATSASNAAGSASTASTQAGLATSAKDAAATSETNASQSASAAATSAANAAGSASTATTQAGLATSAKDAAATSETNASQSASAAATSATNAAGSASTATTQAGLATSAKDAAATSETNASQSASAAATSASNAAGSASTATTQAGLATSAKDAAATSETNAGVSATNSATSASNAAGSAASAATSLLQVQSTIRGTSLGLPLEQWTLNNQTIVDLTDGKVGTKALRLSGPGDYPNQGNYVPLDTTKKYRVKFWARPSSTTTGTLYFSLRQFLDNTGTPGPVNGGRSPYKPAGKTRAQHIADYGDTWGEYNFTWSSADWQAGVKFVQPEFLDNFNNQTGYWDIQAFTFTDVTETEELTAVVETLASTTAGPDGLTAQYTVKTDVNGYVAGFGLSNTVNTAGVATSEFTIVADKFAIAPVNTSNTAADGSPFFHRTAPTTINGVVIPAGTYMKSAFIHDATITTAKIADLAVDNAKIADLAVDNAKIADLAVDNAKIANLNADKITAGFINADRIEAGSISANKISSGTTNVFSSTSGTFSLGDQTFLVFPTTASMSANGDEKWALTGYNFGTTGFAHGIGGGSSSTDGFGILGYSAFNISAVNIRTLGGLGQSTVAVTGNSYRPSSYGTTNNLSQTNTQILGGHTNYAGIFRSYIDNSPELKFEAFISPSNVTTSHEYCGVFSRWTNAGVFAEQVFLATTGYAVLANSGRGKIYAYDGFTPFTGAHHGVHDNDNLPEIGDILVDVLLLEKGQVSSTLLKQAISTTPYQKTVIGVFTGTEDLNQSQTTPIEISAPSTMGEAVASSPAPNTPITETYVLDNEVFININSLGEGQVNVCGENGNIEAGDLIVTSSVPGKGMRQDNDVIRSCTVAKARESVVFDYPTQVKMIACTYLCG